MTTLTFLGTGESCDPTRRNTSLLLEHDGLRHLLDCGFSSAQAYLAQESDIPLAGVWLSHFHGDHFFGLPQLLVHYSMRKRSLPLTVLSGTDCRRQVEAAMELAYPGVLAKLPFPLLFAAARPGRLLRLDGLSWQTAPVTHMQPAFAVRISGDCFALYYSGDGRPTAQAIELMRGCDPVVHEALSLSAETEKHCSIEQCLQLAGELGLPRLALVHVGREGRLELEDRRQPPRAPAGSTLLLPTDGDVIEL